MDNKKKVKARAVPPYMILVYLFVATFVLTGVSFARFGNTTTAEDAATSAQFKVELANVQSDKDLELYLDSDGSEVKANFQFSVTSYSDVPVTYDIYVTTQDGEPILPFGTEMYLTPIDADSDGAESKLALAVAGHRDDDLGTHTHRPNTLQQHKFTGCGFAPAGVHTQLYNLNFHYATVGNVTNSGQYKTKNLTSIIHENIEIKVVARDGRDSATSNEDLQVGTDYTTPYTPDNP